jgi:FKBP-type peptidyl-prolyl cis-trans isomerase
MENQLNIQTTKEGAGVGASVGDVVVVHYTGKLTDGKVFDSSIPRGQPFEFRLGEGMVIAGWEEGIKGMKVGEKRTLTIPGNMAYGSNGVPNRGSEGYLIPPNATLVFDVELLAVK